MTASELIKIRTYSMNFVLNEAHLLATLRRLTLHSRSGLNHELNNFQKIIKIRPVNAKAIVVYLDEKVIAWALLSKEASTFHFRNGTEYNAGYGLLFEVYVAEDHRRKGVASQILKRAKLIAGSQKICIAPHDYKSHAFYNFHFQQNKYHFKEL